MATVLLLPVILSLLVLGAHFLRAGNLVLLLALLALVGCLAARRRWVPPLVQTVLALGALEWVRTLLLYAGERARAGEPYARLVVILGSVAFVTALSALVFLTPRLRARYGTGPGPAGRPGASATGLLLGLLSGLLLGAPAARAQDDAGPSVSCPTKGPNPGNPPQIVVAVPGSEGRRIGICADVEGRDGRGLLSGRATLLELREGAEPTVVWSGEEDANRLRLEGVPERGVRVTVEALLARVGGPLAWTPFSEQVIGCSSAGCRPEGERCVLRVALPEGYDATARVRVEARGRPTEASGIERLTDDLLAQALTGDDRAGWILDHFDGLYPTGGDVGENLKAARALLTRAVALGCPGLEAAPEPGPIGFSPADGGPAPPPFPIPVYGQPHERPARPAEGASVAALAWLAGGRWQGHGTLPNGSEIQVEEDYAWGPARRTIRITAWDLSRGARTHQYDALVFRDPRGPGLKIWSLAHGGLTESTIARADGSGYEAESPDGRWRVARAGANAFLWTLRTLQDGSWKVAVSVTYRRVGS